MAEATVTETKTCTTCGETKPLSEFPKFKQYRDGLRPDCKPCFRAKLGRCPTRTPEHRAWDAAKRTGQMCAEWRDDFGAFSEDMGPRPMGHLLCRRDTTQPFTPANCMWGTWVDHSASRTARKPKHYKTREYQAWHGAKYRCEVPTAAAWDNYGGRGITMCREWSDSFDKFLSDMGPCPPGHTLDRVNNALGYSRDNCAWRTMRDQINNTRANRVLTLNGVSHTVAEWARMANISGPTLRSRLRNGVSPERAVTEPVLTKAEVANRRWPSR